MKKIFLYLSLLCLGSEAVAQKTKTAYNDSLAQALGADEYGMKKYVLVILKTGSNPSKEKHFVDSCFAGHMSNMDVMVKAGQLLVAGPIGKNEKNYRGIFILNAKDKEQAQAIQDGA